MALIIKIAYEMNRLYLRIYTHIHVYLEQQLVKKETMSFKDSEEEYTGGCRWRKGKEQMS